MPSEYQGRLRYTETRRACVRWSSLEDEEYADNDFPDKTVEEAYSYCRDPKGEKGALWCYTSSKDMFSWETCGLLGIVRKRAEFR